MKSAPSADVAPPRTLWYLLVLAAAAPLTVAIILFALAVPLGKPGTLVYLYSRYAVARAFATPAALILAVAAAIGVWMAREPGDAAAGRSWRARAGVALTMLAVAGTGVWAYSALPAHVNQHIFNFLSPSHDGAFTLEAMQIDDACDYLRDFPRRAQTPPAEMKGTRVISNPPGATMLFYGVRRYVESAPAMLASLDQFFLAEGVDLPRHRVQQMTALVSAWLLAAMWIASAPLLYLAGRLYLSRSAALAFSACCTITPATLLFMPGKDVAQLFTAAALTWLWLSAARRDANWAALLFGVAVVVTAMVSLVHVWIAGAVVAANFLGAELRDTTERRRALRRIAVALGGSIAAALALKFALALDIVATARAVAASQAQVTRGPGAMPLLWQTLGVPLFLLFAGPGLWSIALLREVPNRTTQPAAHEHARFGAWLLVLTSLCLIATVGFTNMETPRLWIPFMPLLMLGAFALALPMPTGRVAARLLAVLVFLQLSASALHWTLMDMREAEMRLSTRRMFD